MPLKETTACLGFTQAASLGSATSLTQPSVGPQGQTPTLVIVHAGAQAVRWRDDGTAPTATVGMRLQVGQELRYDGDLRRIQFIEEVAGAQINCSFYA